MIPPTAGARTRESVYTVLRDTRHPLTRAEIERLTGRTDDEVARVLVRLVEQDRATVIGVGWTLTAMERRIIRAGSQVGCSTRHAKALMGKKATP